MITCTAKLLSSRKSLLALAFMFSLPLAALLAMPAAASETSQLVNSLPAQIPEIVTGGTWKNGDVGGVYRAVVVMSDNKKVNLAAKSNDSKSGTQTHVNQRKAEVFIQWIALGKGKGKSKIVKTVSVREFNEKQLRHAFLAMDTLTDNEMTLLVTSYDEDKDKDVSISVKATVPGKYHPAK